MKSFNISDAISFGWDKVKAHLGFFVLAFLIIGAVSVLLNFGTNYFKEEQPLISSLIQLVSVVVNLLLSIGILKVGLDISEGKEPQFSEIFSQTSYLIPYLIASIIVEVVVGIGFLLLIVPGVILMLKFMFCGYFIVDKDSGIMESLKHSSTITDGVKWKLLLFVLVLAVINGIGALLLGIGLLITAPLGLMATIWVYKQLLSQTEDFEEAGSSQDSNSLESSSPEEEMGKNTEGQGS